MKVISAGNLSVNEKFQNRIYSIIESEKVSESAGKRPFEANKMGILPSLPSKVSWAIAVFFMGTKQLNLLINLDFQTFWLLAVMVLAYGGLSYAGLCQSHMRMLANHGIENYDLKLVNIN